MKQQPKKTSKDLDNAHRIEHSSEFSNGEPRTHYQLVADIIEHISQKRLQQPNLNQLASDFSVSESHLQRVFSEWAGVSPKQFLQFLTKEHAKQALKSHSVLEAAYETGLSSGSRLHDLFVHFESVTPGEIKSGGKGLEISYGTHPCPFGQCFIAKTERGICKLALFDDAHEAENALEQLRQDWPAAKLHENKQTTQATIQQIFDPVSRKSTSLHLLMKGSPFKLKVWEALLSVPTGQMRSYQDIAKDIGQPTATRAVASAIATNDIAIMIPCHRVIRSTGEISQYRWGATRKAALLGWEQAKISL
mgnify:CR=1 FL=1